MGLKLFIHAIGQVFNHLGAAIRISALLCVIGIAVSYLATSLFASVMQHPVTGQSFPIPAPGMVIAASIIWVAILMWIAVAWHRYVLLDETPGGLFPQTNGERVWAYFGRSLLLGLVMALIGFVVFIPLGFVTVGIIQSAPGPLGLMYASVPTFIAYFIIATIGYRFSVVLPATAVGKPLGLSEAWSATSEASGAIAVVAFLSALCVVALDLALTWVQMRSPWWVGWPLELLVAWAELIVGISIITTLYGHYVERRPLATAAAPA